MTGAKSLWCSAPLLLALVACGPQTASGPETTATAKPVATQAPNDGATGLADVRVGTPVPPRSMEPAAMTAQTPPAATPAPAAQTGTPVPSAASPAAVPPPVARVTRTPSAAQLASAGEVRAIEPIRERPPGTGKGAVIGGVLGGVVGNQFGHGNGRAAMTVLGAAGGAVAGNNVERNMNKRIVGYRVSVRLDNGQARTFTEPRLDGLRVGDRVRVDGKHVRRA
jgi:outer membrane lipoprotein SlyB